MSSDQQVVSLCDAYKDYFPIGAAVSSRCIHTHRDLLLRHFCSVTATNEMKFSSIHPDEGSYQFVLADSIVEFAEANDMLIRGHTLVWHLQTPERVFINSDGASASRDLLLSRMRDHIETVVSRYKGRVYCWDVVNEAIDDKGSDYLRPSKWLQIIGPDYIEKAFEYAHAVDPDALLFYNDYNAVAPYKREKIMRLITELQQKGIPIHGIGLQGHWNIYWPSVDEIRYALDDYARLGLTIQITELDLSVFAYGDTRIDLTEPTSEMMELQAKRYEELFRLFREYKGVISGVTFWGIADDVTWLHNFPVRGRRDWPLLFDCEHQPKESFYRVARF